MKYSDEYINNLKNMNIEEFKKTLGDNKELSSEINEDNFEILKNEIVKDLEMNNDILDLVSKYGFDCLATIIEKCLEHLKMFTKFATMLSKNNSKLYKSHECCCQIDRDEKGENNEC